MAAVDSVAGNIAAKTADTGRGDAAAPLPPLALYVHFPWCVKKCPYCDFNSHQARATVDRDGYVAALLADLAADAKEFAGDRVVGSVFLGGGTPSLFDAAAIGEVLDGVRACLRLADDAEVTMEANPGAVEHDDFAGYRAAGGNRLSIGAQSFNDAHLNALGRIHKAAEIGDAIRAAQHAGFDNLNVDLMHGLPGQTLHEAVDDLHCALQFSPAHLSLYQLTIEPNTWFHRYPPKLPDDDAAAAMQAALHSAAAAAGYARYEISAFARDGRQCRHNRNYWEFGDYIGIGAGAHGKVTAGGGGGKILRYWKVKHPRQYVDAVAVGSAFGGRSQVAGADALFEFLLNALRLCDGFDVGLIASRTGCNVEHALSLLDDAIARGLAVHSNGRIGCTARGLLFLDEVLAGVLPEV